MEGVSFVKESGFVSAGQTLSNLAKRHEKSKTHTVNYTAYQLLGNVDVACAVDKARQRDVARHNHSATRLSKMLFRHIDVTVFLAAQGLAHFVAMMNLNCHPTEEIFAAYGITGGLQP